MRWLIQAVSHHMCSNKHLTNKPHNNTCLFDLHPFSSNYALWIMRHYYFPKMFLNLQLNPYYQLVWGSISFPPVMNVESFGVGVTEATLLPHPIVIPLTPQSHPLFSWSHKQIADTFVIMLDLRMQIVFAVWRLFSPLINQCLTYKMSGIKL